jgi:uncharacterized protein (TIGR00251 family)
MIRIRLTAPPVEGAANDELVRFLAETLSVPGKAILIVSGQSSRSKVLEIRGVIAREVAARLGL